MNSSYSIDTIFKNECIQSPVTITHINNKQMSGVLCDFSPETNVITLTQNTSPPNTIAIDLINLKTMQCTTEKSWCDLIANEHANFLETDHSKPFSITFLDQSTLSGEYFGALSDNQALHVFLALDSTHYRYAYVPHSVIKQHDLEPSQPIDETSDSNPESIDSEDVVKTINNAKHLELALSQQKTMPQLRLGEILISEQLINEEELEAALEEQTSKRHIPLGQILVSRHLVTTDQIQRALAKKLGIPLINIKNFQILPETIQLVPEELIFKHKIMPLCSFDNKLAIALENPLNFDALEDLRFHTGKFIEPVMATEKDIENAIQMYYSSASNALDSIYDEAEEPEADFDDTQLSRDEEQVADNIVVKLINKIILDAHRQGVSDIHIEPAPGKEKVMVRFRKDGTLIKYHEFPAQYRLAIISRIKIMAKLDISEKRKPQDGKIQFRQYSSTNIELRVATLPTTGDTEDIVMRLLASNKPVPIDKLGLSSKNYDDLLTAIANPYGLFLVCGPTGSGKTTTLHSVLGQLNTTKKKIWTAEDPVEITQRGLRQVQVNPKIGLDFSSAMRAFLRADPDIIMVGEMRDQETSSMAIEASLTGHMVLSTLHTNSAVESITRLLDMGMDPFNFADALLGILSQRLAKSLCPDCKTAYTPNDDELRHLASEYQATRLDNCDDQAQKDSLINQQINEWLLNYGNKDKAIRLYSAQGCGSCNNTGYLGRIGLHELLIATDGIKHRIISHKNNAEIKELALEQGMKTIKQDGIDKILQGLTDYSKVIAVSPK